MNIFLGYENCVGIFLGSSQNWASLRVISMQFRVFFGGRMLASDSILTLTVFQSRRFFTLARPYIKYMLHSLQIFRHISCVVSILTI